MSALFIPVSLLFAVGLLAHEAFFHRESNGTWLRSAVAGAAIAGGLLAFGATTAGEITIMLYGCPLAGLVSGALRRFRGSQ